MANPTHSTPKRATQRALASTKSLMASIPEKYHVAVAIGALLLLLLVFFGMAGVVGSDKIFAANDAISWESFRPYVAQTNAKGESPMWIPYIFSGMPAFGSYLVTGDRWWDLGMKIVDVAEHAFGFSNYLVMRMVLYYFLYGIGMFLLARSKKMNTSVAMMVAIAAVFSAWIIVYVMIGHNTKMMVLMTFPYILLCLDKLTERFSLFYAGLLIFAIHLFWEGNHPQTAFYGVCAFGIYILCALVGKFMNKESGGVAGPLRGAAVLLVAGAMAYGMGLDRNADRSEYTPYSTRIAPPITDTTKAEAKSDDQYQYMTNWSFSVPETFTYMVPAYFGSGKLKYSGPVTNNEPQLVPTYWGQMSFTDTGHYAGIAILILALIGTVRYRKNPFVIALVASGLFGLILSYGRNFPLLYDLFYKFVPNFNQLRAPSQSLILLEFALPLLAGFGLQSVLDARSRGSSESKGLLYGAMAMGGFTVLGLLGGAIIKGSYIGSMKASANLNKYPDELFSFIYTTMITDWIVAGALGTGALLLLYYFQKGRLTQALVEGSLIAIVIVDLWRVDLRPLETKSYAEAMSAFDKTDIDGFLDSDKSKYRIMDLTAPGPNFVARQLHEHVLGYHAAKLRNYQNLLDVCGNGNVPTAPTAWNLLNMKYVVSDKPIAEGMPAVFQSSQKNGINVFRNDNALPRAWFVNTVDVAADLAVLEMIRDGKFDPRQVAYVPKKLAVEIAPADSMCTAINTLYEPHHIAFDVNASGNNLLVFSEIYYPPTWHASIDGKPTDIIQTDYLLRGIIVPPGKHVVKMECFSESMPMNRNIVLGLNIAMLGLIGAGTFMQFKRKPTASA